MSDPQTNVDGRSLETGAPVPPSTCVLTASDVWKTYRRGVWSRRRTVQVLKGADLTVGRGEVVGLVGGCTNASHVCRQRRHSA